MSKVQLDMKGNTYAKMPSIPHYLKFLVYGFWIAIGIILLCAGLNAGQLYLKKDELNHLSERIAYYKDELKKLDKYEQKYSSEKRKAENIVHWLNIQYPVHKMLEVIFKDASKEIKYEKLDLRFSEAQPQIHIKMDINGNSEALMRKCSEVSKDLTDIGFRSISISQPWSSNGIVYDGLFMIPGRERNS